MNDRWLRSRLRQLVGRQFALQIGRPVTTLGSTYGAWTILSDSVNPQSVVYSFGVGEDISFDLSLIANFGVIVHAFDPTPRSISWVETQEIPESLQFCPYGVADFDGQAKFTPPLKPDHVSHTILDRQETADQAIEVPVFRLSTILHRIGHSRIDVLKMDVEGAEYRVLADLVASKIQAGQILVEFHHHFPEVSWQETRTAVRRLQKAGFMIFHISANGFEYSFVHKDQLT